MPFLPVAERELREASRRKSTYRTRFWAVIFAACAFGWHLIDMNRSGIDQSAQGHGLFTTLVIFAFIYCLLVGAKTTADSISVERREGTLGLLFLTDLKGYDIIIGKIVASSLNAFYGLVAIIPMLALCVLFGGVGLVVFLQSVLLLVTTMMISLASGVFVSTFNTQDRKAMFYTILLLMAVTLGPVILAVIFFSGGEPQALAGISPLFALAGILRAGFWHWIWQIESAVCMTLLSWLLLSWAAQRLPHCWKSENGGQTTRKNPAAPDSGRMAKSVTFRRTLLDHHPYAWLSLRGPDKIFHAYGFVGAMLAIWLMGHLLTKDTMNEVVVLVPGILFIHGFIKVWAITEASARLVEDRRSGALELLLSTPLGPQNIVRGQHHALLRQFGWPVLVLLLVELIGVVWGSPEIRLFLISSTVFLVADLWTIRWLAMWVAVNVRTLNRAILTSSLLILALPWGLTLGIKATIGWFSDGTERWSPFAVLLVIGLAVNAILLVWARGKFLREFWSRATAELPRENV